MLKGKLGYDDTLDAFGVHGVGGTLGTSGANPRVIFGITPSKNTLTRAR